MKRSPPPTWTDEEGTLVIRYSTHYPNGTRYRENDAFECIFTVDANQDFALACPLSKAQITRRLSDARRIVDRTGTKYIEYGIESALRLATGSDSYEEAPAPTWSDEDGTLVVRYHRYISKDDQAQPSLHACTLTVDASRRLWWSVSSRAMVASSLAGYGKTTPPFGHPSKGGELPATPLLRGL